MGQKRIRNSLAIALIPFFLMAMMSAAAADTTPCEVVITHPLDLRPYAFVDERGESKGVAIDLMRIWGRKVECGVRFVPAEAAKGVELLKAGKADIVGGMHYYGEFHDEIDFAREFLEIEVDLFADKAVPIKSIDGVGPLPVGVVAGGFPEKWLQAQYPQVALRRFAGNEDLVRSALAGGVAAFVLEYPVAGYYLARHGAHDRFTRIETLYLEKLRVGVRRGNAELLKRINAGMHRITFREVREVFRQWSIMPAIPEWLKRYLWLAGAGAVFVLLLVFIVVLRVKVRHRTRRIEEVLDEVRVQNRRLETEIQERQRAEDALADERNLLRTIINNIPDIVFAVDGEGKALVLNDAGRRYLAPTDREPIAGRDIVEFMPEDVVLKCRQAVSLIELDPNLALSEEGRFSGPDGNERWFLDTAVPLRDEAGGVMGMVCISRDITRQKLAEISMRRALNELESFVTTIPDMFYVLDTAGRLIKWNRKFEEATGYDSAELVSRNIAHLFTPMCGSEATCLGEEHPRLGRGNSLEVYVRNRSGELILYEFVTSALKDENSAVIGYVGIGRDITERHRYEDALRVSEERFRSIFDLADVSIWEIDYEAIRGAVEEILASGVTDIRAYLDEHPDDFDRIKRGVRIVDVNEASVKLYGASSKEELIAGIEKIFLAESIEAFKDVIAAVASGSRFYQVETRRRTMQGAIITVILRVSVPAPESAFRNILITTIDVTEQKRHEAALQAAKDAAEIANRAKSTFLANMSHELRTPLNSVIAMSDMLVESYLGELNPEQADYVRDIRESGRHLLNLINDILDLSKVEAGYSPLEPGPVDLAQLVANSLVVVRERALKHGIALSIDVAGTLPEIVADERKVKQIVFNLLSNAVKFTGDGGSVGVRAAARDGGVELCVWDTGIGIAPENIDRVFGEFYQVEETLTKRYEGTGLGLSLVKRFAEQHGGHVRVESEPGKGSRFYVFLPAVLAETAVRGGDGA